MKCSQLLIWKKLCAHQLLLLWQNIIISSLALIYVYFESAEKIQVERMKPSTLFRETSVMAWGLVDEIIYKQLPKLCVLCI